MPARLLMRLFIAVSVVAVLGGLTFVYVRPPRACASRATACRTSRRRWRIRRPARRFRWSGWCSITREAEDDWTSQTIAQLLMFCVAFGTMALAFFSDSL